MSSSLKAQKNPITRNLNQNNYHDQKSEIMPDTLKSNRKIINKKLVKQQLNKTKFTTNDDYEVNPINSKSSCNQQNSHEALNNNKKSSRVRFEYLFDNLQRAVSEIFQTCENDRDIIECKVLFNVNLKFKYS